MTIKLPKRLHKEPILDALFECRLDVPFPISNIMPGIFFSDIKEDKRLERLPHSEIPGAIRNSDPDLQYLPLVKICLDNYSFLIGDSSVAVACNLPYRGWNDFKSTIIKMINILKSSGLIKGILRYSIKYVDFIQSNDPADQVSLPNLSLKIGSHNLTKEPYQVRMDIPVDGFINVVQIISGAKVTQSDKSSLEGVVIDIDTIKNTDGISLEEMEKNLEESLDHIHRINKRIFFDCLTEQTLTRLEPEYE
ncbi:TIGR04255 family protein [Candidatus Magnetomoraceae bacterium gMMP-15]